MATAEALSDLRLAHGLYTQCFYKPHSSVKVLVCALSGSMPCSISFALLFTYKYRYLGRKNTLPAHLLFVFRSLMARCSGIESSF